MSDTDTGVRVLSNADGIVVMAINRPARGNSVTPQLMVELGKLLDEAEEDPDCRAIVLTGTGKVFCSGADIVEMREHVAQHGVDGLADYMVNGWLPAVQATFRKVHLASPLVIAAINGAAIGGGLALALHCDLRIAYRDAKIGESHVKVGILPGAGSILAMKGMMGAGAALRSVLTGEHIRGAQAREIGLVDEVVDTPADVVPTAVELARSLSGSGRGYVAGIKAIMRGDAADDTLDRHFEICLRENARLFAAPHGTDALAKALADR